MNRHDIKKQWEIINGKSAAEADFYGYNYYANDCGNEIQFIYCSYDSTCDSIINGVRFIVSSYDYVESLYNIQANVYKNSLVVFSNEFKGLCTNSLNGRALYKETYRTKYALLFLNNSEGIKVPHVLCNLIKYQRHVESCLVSSISEEERKPLNFKRDKIQYLLSILRNGEYKYSHDLLPDEKDIVIEAINYFNITT